MYFCTLLYVRWASCNVRVRTVLRWHEPKFDSLLGVDLKYQVWSKFFQSFLRINVSDWQTLLCSSFYTCVKKVSNFVLWKRIFKLANSCTMIDWLRKFCYLNICVVKRVHANFWVNPFNSLHSPSGRTDGLISVFIAASWSWGRKRAETQRDLVEARRTTSSTNWPRCYLFLQPSPRSLTRPPSYVWPSLTWNCATSRGTETRRGAGTVRRPTRASKVGARNRTWSHNPQ